MNAKECLKLLRTIKSVAFATVDQDGRPQARIIDVMLAEEDKLYFVTARGKDFYRQLLASGQVAVTALSKNYEMIRLTGRADLLGEQKKWLDRIFQENPVMNQVYPGDSRYALEPFCISRGEIEYFDLGRSPVFRESYSLGRGPVSERGFFIGQACDGCGLCAKLCPQGCVESGEPFRIRQENCLHCGLCLECCPSQAVVQRGAESC